MATAFYGISFNITGFGLNIYLTQFTYALIELPAKVSVYYLLDKIGRRRTEVGTLLMASVCLGINIVIPKGRHSLMSTDLRLSKQQTPIKTQLKTYFHDLAFNYFFYLFRHNCLYVFYYFIGTFYSG